MNTKPNPMRVRIASHITQSRFLHIEDALNIGKFRFFAGNYRKGRGMLQQGFAHAFVDIADARVLFAALSRGEQGFTYREYKGTPPKNGKPAISRVLSVAVKGEKVYVELISGPGKLTPTGAITPHGSATTAVNVPFKLHEARRMAASILAYLHAWDVMRMMVHHGMMGHHSMMANQSMVSAPIPYLLVPAARDGVERDLHGQVGPYHPTPPAVAGRRHCRPVTHKGNAAAGSHVNGRSHNGHDLKNEKQSPTNELRYGDGTAVSADNLTEQHTYHRYQESKGAIPPSKAALQTFFQRN